MTRLRIYIETTVWNFALVDDSPDRREATVRFFDEARRGVFDLYISSVVLDEVNAASEPRLSQLNGLIDELAPTVLRPSDEAEELAAKFVANGMIPEKYGDDALHIAIALTEGMDALLSWNFKHIVKMKTARMVDDVCRESGYERIQIRTPEEVTNDNED